ncbi:MAG: hypothetical protein U1F49_09805 [Rubrivivax sp.]
MDIDYDPDVYPQGRPNVTALLRGAKVYDPAQGPQHAVLAAAARRAADATTWEFSENPALHALHYARAASSLGGATARSTWPTRWPRRPRATCPPSSRCASPTTAPRP